MKAGEIRIRGDEFATMFDRQSGQVRIGYEISHRLTFAEHLLEDLPMPFGRVHNSCAWLSQPTLNPGRGLIKGERLLENAGVGADAYERRQDRPAQAYGRSPRQGGVPPRSCLGVVRTELVFRIEQDICIHENQRLSSPSI